MVEEGVVDVVGKSQRKVHHRERKGVRKLHLCLKLYLKTYLIS